MRQRFDAIISLFLTGCFLIQGLPGRAYSNDETATACRISTTRFLTEAIDPASYTSSQINAPLASRLRERGAVLWRRIIRMPLPARAAAAILLAAETEVPMAGVSEPNFVAWVTGGAVVGFVIGILVRTALKENRRQQPMRREELQVNRRDFLRQSFAQWVSIATAMGAVFGGVFQKLLESTTAYEQRARLIQAGHLMLNRLEQSNWLPVDDDWAADHRTDYVKTVRDFMANPRFVSSKERANYLWIDPRDADALFFRPFAIASLDSDHLMTALAYALLDLTAAQQGMLRPASTAPARLAPIGLAAAPMFGRFGKSTRSSPEPIRVVSRARFSRIAAIANRYKGKDRIIRMMVERNYGSYEDFKAPWFDEAWNYVTRFMENVDGAEGIYFRAMFEINRSDVAVRELMSDQAERMPAFKDALLETLYQLRIIFRLKRVLPGGAFEAVWSAPPSAFDGIPSNRKQSNAFRSILTDLVRFNPKSNTFHLDTSA